MPTIEASPGLVGRRQEVEQLRLWLFDQAAQFALVAGDAGIGKTRLLKEVAQSPDTDGVKVLRARCYSGSPLAPLLPVLEVFAELEEAPETGAVAAQLTRLLHLPPTSHLGSTGGDARLRAFSRLSDDLLAKTRPARTLILIDDLQWIDADSLLFFSYLLDVAPDVSILAAKRTPASPPEAAGLGVLERRGPTLELEPLTPAETAELASQVMEGVSSAEATALYELSGGNPLFLLQLVSNSPRDGPRPAFAGNNGALPRSLAGYLDQRLGDLGQDTLLVLSAAAVGGQRFEPAVLTAVLDISENGVEDALEEATGLGVVSPLQVYTESAFEFSHPLFRERLYQRLGPRDRRDLHERFGSLPAPYQDRLSLEERAIHRALGFKGEHREEVIALCRAAAEHAERMVAYQSAVEFWRLALSCEDAPDSPRKASILQRMGLAFRAYGDWDSAIPTLERAFEIYEYASDGTASGTVACYLGEMLRFRQELDAARMWLDRALERDIEIRDRQRALALLASTHAAQDEYNLANEALSAALDLSPLPSADVFYWSYFTLLVQGRIDDARASAALGLETAQEAGDDANSAMLARSLCQVELERLNLNQAEQLARVVRRYSSPSDTVSMIRAMVCDCFVGGIRGRWESVEQTCQEWEAVARHAGRFQLAVARMMHAEALSALGKHEAALDFAEESVPLLGNNRDLGSLHLARLYLRAGAPEKARPLVERVAPRVTSKERFAAARVLLADLVELVGDDSLVKDIYSALASEQRRVVAVYTPLSVTRARARLAAHQKLWLECFRLFETAITELERAAASWEHALALGDYAAARWRRRAKGDARRAEALEAQALALFPDSTLLLARQYSANYDPQAVLGLSPREREVLHLLTQGRRNSEIAEVLTVSTHTVDRHLENMFLKLGVRNRTEAVLKAAAVGVVFEPGTVSL